MRANDANGPIVDCTVTVNTGFGNCTIRLDVPATTTIIANPLLGALGY